MNHVIAYFFWLASQKCIESSGLLLDSALSCDSRSVTVIVISHHVTVAFPLLMYVYVT